MWFMKGNKTRSMDELVEEGNRKPNEFNKIKATAQQKYANAKQKLASYDKKRLALEKKANKNKKPVFVTAPVTAFGGVASVQVDKPNKKKSGFRVGW